MTSEQRNEIAMEVLDEVLTEATRYAKETHKKRNQRAEDYNRYHRIRENVKRGGEGVVNEEELDKKTLKAYRDARDASKKDSIRYGREGRISSGKCAASKQPGRYDY